jgi:hypothetical protein
LFFNRLTLKKGVNLIKIGTVVQISFAFAIFKYFIWVHIRVAVAIYPLINGSHLQVDDKASSFL